MRTKKVRIIQHPFPRYLPNPDPASSVWIAKRLVTIRGCKSVENIARSAGFASNEILEIEKGKLCANLGQFRQLLAKGYSTSLTDLLSEYYQEKKHLFPNWGKRPFDRDVHYSLRLEASGNRGPTPLFVGGDPERYLWGVPLRRLKNQPVVTEYLELAPKRKNRPSGATQENNHDGIEVLHVIHGTVEIHTEGPEDAYTRKVHSGESFHFHSSRPHHVENEDKNLSALLLVVRYSDNVLK